MKRLPALLAVLAALALGGMAEARSAPTATPPATTADASTAPAEQEAQGSPRASMRRFLEATHAGNFQEASSYLELSRAEQDRGPDLAKELHDVLEQKLVVAPDELSAKSNGLPDAVGGVITLGEVDDGERTTSIKLVQRETREAGRPSRWVFAKSTVQQIDRLYGRLEGTWAREHLPAPLLARGPKGLYVWQWLGVPLLAFVSAGIGVILSWLLGAVVRQFFDPCSRTARFLPRLRAPVRLAWATLVFWLASPLLVLPIRADDFTERVLGVLAYVSFFWAAVLVLLAAGDEVSEGAWVEGRPTARTLTVVGVRLGKVVIIAIGLMLALSRLGYSPTSIIAGLGLGGIVVALAAQKTVENFIGSLAILLDQPFHIGDRIRVGDFVRTDTMEGVVENIGLRTTRLRTNDRTVIIIPNGRLADSRIESLSEREVARLTTHIRLSRAPTAAQLRVLRTSLKHTVRKHPLVRSSEVTVELGEIGESSFDLHVTALIETVDLVEFERVRGEVLLSCIETVEDSGFELAVPTTHSVITPASRLAPQH